jgi:hypothetical protein
MPIRSNDIKLPFNLPVLSLVYLKARVAVLILAKGWSPDHCNCFQVSPVIGLGDNGKTQHPTFAGCKRELSLA